MRRREFLFNLAGGAALGADPRVEITSVRAARVPFRPASAFGTKEFASDRDPARHRWFGPFSQLTGEILVRIDTAGGITGWGLGGGGGASVRIIEQHLRDLLVGANALAVERLWRQMFDSSSFYGRKGLAVMAISGVDLALWDIRGRFHGKPVQELAGGAVRQEVPAYFTGNNWQKGLELGCRAFKLPVREGPAQGVAGMKRTLARLKEVRAAAGDDARIMVDCLARWDVEHTLAFAQRAEDLQLYFIEEPLYPYDIDGYRTLCAKVRGTKIACGEHEYTRYGFRQLIRARAAHILQPDLTWSGGLSECLQVVSLGAAHNLPVIPHRGGSPYGLALIFTTKHCPLAESFGTGENDNELWQAFTARFENGYYLPNTKPGFGVDLSEKLLRKYVPQLLG